MQIALRVIAPAAIAALLLGCGGPVKEGSPVGQYMRTLDCGREPEYCAAIDAAVRRAVDIRAPFQPPLIESVQGYVGTEEDPMSDAGQSVVVIAIYARPFDGVPMFSLRCWRVADGTYRCEPNSL